MSKIKRVLALLLAMTMVMGMSMTTFAAGEKAEITVNDAQNATLTYAQVIKPDQTTTTGWAFCSPAIAKAYLSAFGMTDEQDPQLVIEAMIKEPTGNTAAFSQALSNVAGIVTFDPMANPQEVTTAGVYAIRATEPNYTYNYMAAYVGFGEVEGSSYPALLDATLTAKKSPATVIKGQSDPDDVVAIGDEITYTVEAYVPYILPENTNKTFFIYDNLTGATYDLTGEIVNATVTMSGSAVTPKEIEMTNNGTGFSIDLSNLINDDNSNAGEKIVVTYKAVVTAVTADNRAEAGHKGGSQFGSDTTTIYTGQITLTKYNEDKKAKLAGAGFKVTKTDSETPLTALTFVKVSDGVYTYSPEGRVTEVFTDENGSLVVQGLDVGTYHFEETTAPEGYSINADGADATLTVTEKATKIVTAETNLTDTKLSALPSTGGIGTTIFTIGGCLIMLIAAFLFFAIRRKSVK